MSSLIAQWTKKWAEKTNHPFLFYTQTTSTSDKAKEYFTNNGKYKSLLFIAESQTKGRGRRNRQWINSDMMISWSYSLKKAPQPITTTLMCRALYEALNHSWKQCPFEIKNPNDICINNRKLAGLLIEAISKGDLQQLIIGVGMNIFSHPSSGSYTHLQEHITQKKINKEEWFLFLDEWNKQINKKIKSCMKES